MACAKAKLLEAQGKHLEAQPVVAATPVATAATPSAPATRAGAVAIGDAVEAPFLPAYTKPTATKVVGFYGKLVHLEGEFTKGPRKFWRALSEITPAGSPLPDPQGDHCSVVLGQKVHDSVKDLARVGEVYGKMARIVYADSEFGLVWLPCEDLKPGLLVS